MAKICWKWLVIAEIDWKWLERAENVKNHGIMKIYPADNVFEKHTMLLFLFYESSADFSATQDNCTTICAWVLVFTRWKFHNVSSKGCQVNVVVVFINNSITYFCYFVSLKTYSYIMSRIYPNSLDLHHSYFLGGTVGCLAIAF